MERSDLEKRFDYLANDIKKDRILPMCKSIALKLGDSESNTHPLISYSFSRYKSKENRLMIIYGNKPGSIKYGNHGIYVIKNKEDVLRARQIYREEDEEDFEGIICNPIVNLGWEKYEIMNYHWGKWVEEIRRIYDNTFSVPAKELKRYGRNLCIGWHA